MSQYIISRPANALIVATSSLLPPSAVNGALAVTVDTDTLYVYETSSNSWVMLVSGGGGSGTVTSVGLSLPSIFNVSGSPVMTSGTLTATLASETQNFVFAAPSGSSGTPSFRLLVASDIPALPYLSTALPTNDIFVGNGSNIATAVAMSGDATIVSSGALTISNLAVTNAKIANATIDLTAKVTGILPIANGGTNSSTALSNNQIMISSSGKIIEGGVIVDGQVMIGSTIGAPVAANLAAGAGISIVNGHNSITISTVAGPTSYYVNEFTLSSTDITNKFVTLSQAPDTAINTILTVIGGPMQSYGTDFTVSGSQLSWSGLFLDGVLSSGDILIVQFN